MVWVLLVLVLGAACAWLVGGSGRGVLLSWRGAWRALVVGGWSVGLRSWWCWSSLVLGQFFRLSFGL